MWMGGEFRCGWEESLGVDGVFRYGWEEFIVDVVSMWGLDVDGRRGSIL